MRRDDEEAEEKHRAHDKEPQVQITALGIERLFRALRDIHPLIEMMPQKKNRDEEDCENGHEHGDVFELSPNHHRPIRIGRVVDDRPKEASGTKSEEKAEREQP